MTSPAIQLARECGFTVAEAAYPYEVKPVASSAQLERFYAKAQAQALRDAAEAIYRGMPPNKARDMLRRMADDLERKE